MNIINDFFIREYSGRVQANIENARLTGNERYYADYTPFVSLFNECRRVVQTEESRVKRIAWTIAIIAGVVLTSPAIALFALYGVFAKSCHVPVQYTMGHCTYANACDIELGTPDGLKYHVELNRYWSPFYSSIRFRVKRVGDDTTEISQTLQQRLKTILLSVVKGL